MKHWESGSASELPKKGNMEIEDLVVNTKQRTQTVEKELETVDSSSASLSSHSLAGLDITPDTVTLSIGSVRISFSTHTMTAGNDTYSHLLKRWLDGEGVYPGEPPESWVGEHPDQSRLLFGQGPQHSVGDTFDDRPSPSASSGVTTRNDPDELTTGALARLWENSQKQVESISNERDKARARADSYRYPSSNRGRGRGRGRPSHPSSLDHRTRRALERRGFQVGPKVPVNSPGGVPATNGPGGNGVIGVGVGVGSGTILGIPSDLPVISQPASAPSQPPPANATSRADLQDSSAAAPGAQARVEQWRESAMEIDDQSTARGERQGTPSKLAISDMPALPEEVAQEHAEVGAEPGGNRADDGGNRKADNGESN
ncbi:hypothetical protein FRC11_006264 [Ceratobasidium sp. 423]|nr:hypothetical protein FRC11_006264 [Ceratobasidium sp. 423]